MGPSKLPRYQQETSATTAVQGKISRPSGEIVGTCRGTLFKCLLFSVASDDGVRRVLQLSASPHPRKAALCFITKICDGLKSLALNRESRWIGSRLSEELLPRGHVEPFPTPDPLFLCCGSLRYTRALRPLAESEST